MKTSIVFGLGFATLLLPLVLFLTLFAPAGNALYSFAMAVSWYVLAPACLASLGFLLGARRASYSRSGAYTFVLGIISGTAALVVYFSGILGLILRTLALLFYFFGARNGGTDAAAWLLTVALIWLGIGFAAPVVVSKRG